MNTDGYKQRLQAEEQRLSNRIERADTDARDLSDGPSVREWGDASVRDEEKDGQNSRKQPLIRLLSSS
jgi:hypothetical protein